MPRQYKLARKMKKITLTAAAQYFGVSQPTLSAWESERKNPPIDTLIHMSKFYDVSIDFLLGLTTASDPRSAFDLKRPISPAALIAFHELPVYSTERGWAFVDAVERQLRFADGGTLPLSDVQEIFFLPPAFMVGQTVAEKPLKKSELGLHSCVWVEPISADAHLRNEMRGWYHVKDRFVENEVGQRFYFDFYEAKWLAFSEDTGNEE